MHRSWDPTYTKIHPEVCHVASAADVLAYSLGPGGDAKVVALKTPFGGGKPVEEDAVSDTASTISNPDRWNNNFAKKMLDMQFFFSCGPLRVAKSCPEHWNRLHATHKTLMPLPGGRLELFQERIPHTTDAELAATIGSMASALPKGPPPLPVNFATKRVDTPLLQHLLQATYVAPLPKKPNPNDPLTLLQRRRDREGGVQLAKKSEKDCDSCFSRTTVASSTDAMGRSRAANNAPSSVSVASTCGSSKTSSKGTAPSASGKGSGLPLASTSQASSATSSKVQKLRSDIDQERTLTAIAMEHIRAASAQLDSLEQVLGSRAA